VISRGWSITEPAYLGNIIIIIVEGETNHLLRMRQKFTEGGKAVFIGDVGRAI
jgi:hypothetical protein